MKAYASNIHIRNAKIVADEGFIGIVGGIFGDVSLFTTIENCSMYNAEIIANNASNVGGIVGQSATSTLIKACLFDGSISGGVEVGGITSISASDDKISNCHTNATLMGSRTIGGIISTSDRTYINNCFVEGEITLNDNAVEARVGGIAGQINYNYQDTVDIVLNNNIIDIANITIPKKVTTRYVHRVVGHSSGDNWEYDWDNIDWSQPQSQWPRLYQSADRCLRNSYIISDLTAFDANIALTDTTTEGATLAREEITTEWLTEHEFAINDSNSIWVINEDSKLTLWFEKTLEIEPEEKPEDTPVDNVEHNSMTFDDQMILTEGLIRIYNSISTAELNTGIYIVTVANNSNFYSTKILVR